MNSLDKLSISDKKSILHPSISNTPSPAKKSTTHFDKKINEIIDEEEQLQK